MRYYEYQNTCNHYLLTYQKQKKQSSQWECDLQEKQDKVNNGPRGILLNEK